MTTLSFTTPKRASSPITFDLDGREYVFTPPKSADMVMPVIAGDGKDQDLIKATFDWLGHGLSEEDHQHLIGRLKDPADDLDVDTLSAVVKGLAQKVAADRPTT